MSNGKIAIAATAMMASLTSLGVTEAARADTADMALAMRAATLGLGAEFDIGLTHSLSARVGYSGFGLSRTVDSSDASYDARLKLSNGELLLDWHPGGHFFRLSAGAVVTGNKVDITGVPAGGNITLGGTTYPATDIGTVTGRLKTGNSIAPYAGFGFGNPLGQGSHFTFLLDLGVMFTGTPAISLTATCSAAVPSTTCAQIQQSAQQEIGLLRSKADPLKVWPVLNLGVGYRF